jgi:SAM-dependent methyltransferase
MADFSFLTELPGSSITHDQLDRLCHRYYWAGSYCDGKIVIEAGCGAGPGLGYFSKYSRSVYAGDYTENILQIAGKAHKDANLVCFDAQHLPFKDNSADVLVIFEAIYYLPSIEQFLDECRRVLKSGGRLLISTANKDLYDFHPSPYSHQYCGVVELHSLLSEHGFEVECFGYSSVFEMRWRQRLLRPFKKAAVSLGLIPSTLDGRKWIKRLVFGKMVHMPPSVVDGMVRYETPKKLHNTRPDREHRVIYCAGILKGK